MSPLKPNDLAGAAVGREKEVPIGDRSPDGDNANKNKQKR